MNYELIQENYRGETHLNLRRTNDEGKLEELFVARFRRYVSVKHRMKARQFSKFLRTHFDLNTITQEELDTARVEWSRG
jgi:hypothetical protein